MKKLYEEQSIQNIANSIRNVNGKTDTYTVAQMPSAIDELKTFERTTWHVLFVDIDGEEILNYYLEDGDYITFPTQARINKMTAKHKYLKFLRWNQTDPVANNENYYTTAENAPKDIYKTIVIGPIYDLIDDDSDTYIELLVNKNLNKTYGIQAYCQSGTTATINWGDGTTSEITKTTRTNHTHTYTASGFYKIRIHINGTGKLYIQGSANNVAGSGLSNFAFGIHSAIFGKNVALYAYACAYCYSLNYVYMHSSVVCSSTTQFNYCYSLSKINISPSWTSIPSSCFVYCSALGALIIPDRVSTLGTSPMQYTYGCFYISLPKSLTALSTAQIFLYVNLNYIPSNLYKLLQNATYGLSFAQYGKFVEDIYYNPNKTDITEYSQRIGNDNIVEYAKIPNGQLNLAMNHFADCGNLKEVQLSDSIETIPFQAFCQCPKLLKVNTENIKTTSGSANLSFCLSLRDIDLSNLQTAVSQCLYIVYGIKKLDLHNLKTAAGSAFRILYGCKSIKLSDNFTTISSTYCFAGNSSLTKFIEPNTLNATSTQYTYNGLTAMKYIKLSKQTKFINTNFLTSTTSLLVIDMSDVEQIPAFGANATSATAGTTSYIATTSLLFIIVPDSLYDDWTTKSTNWTTTFKNYLIKKSDFDQIAPNYYDTLNDDEYNEAKRLHLGTNRYYTDKDTELSQGYVAYGNYERFQIIGEFMPIESGNYTFNFVENNGLIDGSDEDLCILQDDSLVKIAYNNVQISLEKNVNYRIGICYADNQDGYETYDSDGTLTIIKRS